LPGFHRQAPAQVGHERLGAQHAVGDVVAEEHTVLTDGPGMKEAVEACNTFHLGQRQAELAGDRLQ